MAQLIDQILNSGLFAQSAYSASIATKDNLGRDITATYLTGVSIPESADWNDATTAYQTNSSTYITAHQSLDGYATTSELNSTSSYLSGAIDYVSANAGSTLPSAFVVEEDGQAYKVSAYTSAMNPTPEYYDNGRTVFPISEIGAYVYNTNISNGHWQLNGGQGGDISNNIIDLTDVPESIWTYSTNLEIQDHSWPFQEATLSTTAEIVDRTPYLLSGQGGGITGDYVSGVNWVSAQTGGIGPFPPQTVYYEATVSGDVKVTTSAANGLTAMTYSLADIGLNLRGNSAGWNQVYDKLDTTAFDTISGDWNDAVTTYQTNSASYLTSISIPESAKWEEATTTVQTNSSNWDNVTNKLDTTAFSDVSGTFLTAVDLTPYATTAEVDTLSGMLSGAIDYVSANAGDEFPASANEAITAYQNASGTYLTAINIPESADWEDTTDVVQTNSASWSFIPTYEYTDNDLISAIDTSGLYATSAGTANTALWIPEGKRLDQNIYWSGSEAAMYLNPRKSPFTTTSGVFGMLQYATGACLDYYSQNNGTQYFGGFFKGNQWFVSDNNPNWSYRGALMGEVHRNRSVNISGSLTGGAGFVLHPDHVSGRGNSPETNSWKLDRVSVSGLNSTGSWKYGVEEDTALRTVSALEYNAVDEISGIAGSAIAQYGAEKQWLQHDDTIVHVANSAQYAFGVNVSAVAQLLGVDETVLWEGTPVNSTSGNYITLTENASGFESIKVLAGNSDLSWSTISEFPGAANRWEFERISNDTTTYSIIDVAGLYRDSTDSLKWVSRGGSRMQFNSNGTMGYQTSLTSMFVHKVIGIGRKA